MTENFKENVRIFSYISIIIAFAIAFLIGARVVVIPLAVALLFAIVLNPLLRRLERAGINRVLSIILVMLAFIIVVGGVFTYCGYQMAQFISDLPALQSRISELVDNAGNQLEQRFGISTPQQDRWLKQVLDNAGSYLNSFLQTTSSAATILSQIPIYIFLILLYKNKFRRFIEELYKGKKKIATERINEVKGVVQGYVSGMFIVICILAVLNSVGLLILGIKYALFFGIFSALLTVIPYLGNFIGGLFPFVVALVTKDSAWYALGVIMVYAFIQFIEGNFITPNIMSSRVSINPLVALLAMILGGQMLGVAGLILAIPFVAILKIALSKSSTLSPLVVLLEERK